MQNTFDFIIVGAGSAGCVLANRLSKKHSVLLLEAGPKDSHPMIKMPMGFAMLMHDKKRNWCYKTAPEPFMQNREMEWPKGKVLGGSSSINGMVYIRGHQDDFNHWQANGCDGWGWNDVLPYFKRAESNNRGANNFHGDNGPLWVDDVINRFPLAEKVRQAGIAMGLADNQDFNGQQQDGIGYYQVNIKNGRRFSAADAYLKPITKRKNLHIKTNAVTERIVFEGKKATGVKAAIKGTTHQFFANKEVLVSAGTVESPKLLELSGIGQAKLLQSLGIKLVHELSGVGENLQDHLTVNVIHDFKNISTFVDETKPLGMMRNLWLYFAKGKGLLTHPAAELGAFLRSDEKQNRPNLQLHYAPAAGDYDKKGNMVTVPGTTATICQLNPKSRGHIHIQSTDISQHPSIQANYLADEGDRQTMISAIRKVRQLFAESSLAHYDNGELKPGKNAQSDADILDYMQANAVSIYHPVGTCKMGIDSMAVVDTQLRVHGIENLRVIDASVMPTIISGNTHAATVMIAEKAADMLIKAY